MGLTTMVKLGLSVDVVCLLVGLASSRFCPRERIDGFECRAKTNQYKCGIFFQNLLGTGELKWIGALPDAIRKVQKKNPEKIIEIFPTVEGKALSPGHFVKKNCDDAIDVANGQCYLLMSQKNTEPLSSRDATLGNLEGDDKIGNQLCGQARRFLSEAGQPINNGIRDVVISFFSSACEGPWTPVTSSQSGDLTVKERLCCNDKW